MLTLGVGCVYWDLCTTTESWRRRCYILVLVTWWQQGAFCHTISCVQVGRNVLEFLLCWDWFVIQRRYLAGYGRPRCGHVSDGQHSKAVVKYVFTACDSCVLVCFAIFVFVSWLIASLLSLSNPPDWLLEPWWKSPTVCCARRVCNIQSVLHCSWR